MLMFSDRNKLVFGALSILLIGVLTFTYVTYLEISRIICEEEELYSQTAIEKWDQWATHNFSTVTSLAESIASSSKETHHDSKFQFFLSQTMKSGELLYLAYGLEDGYYASGGWPIPDNYDPRTRPWYQSSKKLLAPTITWPYRSVEKNSPLYISLTAPIVKNEQFIGVVTADVTMNYLVKNLFSAFYYRGGSAFLIDETGRIVMHNDEQWIGKHLSELDPEFLNNQLFESNRYSTTHLLSSDNSRYNITSLKNSSLLLVMATDNSYEKQLLKEHIYRLFKYIPIFILLIILSFYYYNKIIFWPVIYSLEYDIATQLPNKNNIKKQIVRRFLAKKKQGALVIISMENFNRLVAAYPKSTIESLQNQVKSRIQSFLKPNSVLGFFSDDSFIVYNSVAENATSIEILACLQLLSDGVTKPYHVEGIELHCAFSIGASCFPSDSINLEQLIDNAFSAIASAREDQRLSYCLFVPEHTQQLGKEVLLANAVKEAIIKREFHLVYQPQIDLRHQKTVGVEALIRWPSSEYGRMISPVEFIDVAENSDLIVELGDYVIDTAVKQISVWNKQRLDFGKVSINISPRQILKDDFITKLLETLQLYEVEACQIELEITETTVLGNPDKSIEVMRDLRNYGFSLAMDDFGTGYSSLEYLKIMPLNKLKIDRVFVKDLDTDERDGVIVKMVVAMANALNYQVVAEGVENKEQLQYLEENGCHLIQGYYFAKPMDATSLESFLTKEVVRCN